MRILYTADLHGNIEYYDLLSKVARDNNVEMVINGGDMLPTEGALFSQMDFISGFLMKHFETMQNEGIRYLCLLGCYDMRVFDDLFDEACSQFPNVTNLAQKIIRIEEHEFVGMNLVADCPFRLKDRCRLDTKGSPVPPQRGKGVFSSLSGCKEIPDWEAYVASLPTIEDELCALPRPRDMKQAIYVTHLPPHGLGLDETWSGRCVGAKSVLSFLERNQPFLSLHGHAHESPQISGRWRAAVGRTTCIQPGQGPSFTYAVLDTDCASYRRRVHW